MREFDFRDAPQEPRPPARPSNLSHLIFAVTILVAMLIYNQSAVAAIVASTVAYGLTTGTIADLIIVWRTTRPEPPPEREPRARLIEPLPLGRQPVGHLAAPGTTFVAPVDDSVRNAAMAFVAQLYTSEGQLDEKKLSLASGRVRCSMPDRAAIEYLESRGLIRPAIKDGHQNGWLFDSTTLPRRHMALNRI